MAIPPTSGSSPAASTVPANPSSDLGKDAFLKLLVAELKNQDPMDPMQSRDMVAQLSQLTGVQKLTDIDDRLGAMQGGDAANAGLQSANLIGRSVKAQTNKLALSAVNSPSGSYQLQDPKGGTVSVNVMDAAGKQVRALDLGAQKAGTNAFQWDGKNEQGVRVAAGSYSFQVTAKDAKGVPVLTSTEVSGRVTEVTYESGAPEVIVNGARVPLSDVSSVAQ